MTWEELEVPASRDGRSSTSRVRVIVGDVCSVEVVVEDIVVRGGGPDLFEALATVRQQLEAHAVMLGCNGARRDVFPSPMLRQASGGRRAYVLSLPRSLSKPPTVDIFAPAPEGSVFASVAEQRAWFDRWRQAKPEPEGGVPA